MQRLFKKSASVFLLFALLPLMIWTLWYEPQELKVREFPLSIPNWPSQFDGMRIALVSDIHAGPPYTGTMQLRKIALATNQATPDLILFLGDLVQTKLNRSGCFVAPELCAPELAKLKAPFGVYGVLGNHDWWYGAPKVSRALEGAGMRLLENRANKVIVRQTPLWLAGVSDVFEHQDNLSAALRDIPRNQPIILLSHNPDIFPTVPERVSLTVSGHTHGGQVNLPILGRLIVPSDYGQRYAAGHIVEGNRHLFVTVGAGNLFPVRFRVPPEVVILTLHRR